MAEIRTLQRATTMGGTTLSRISREVGRPAVEERYIREEIDAVALDAVQEREEVKLRHDDNRHLLSVRLCR